MAFAIIFSVVISASVIAYIIYLFIRDHKILSQGTDVRALVEDVRYVSSNDGGTTTIRYRLSWVQGDVTKQVEGKETIPALYASKVQKAVRSISSTWMTTISCLFLINK